MPSIVVVSHSEKVAEGVVEIASQMAPSVRMVAAGGTGDGRIGTAADRIVAAVEQAWADDGVVLLYDLGSAGMNIQVAMSLMGDRASKMKVLKIPLVEGALVTATYVEGGTALDEIEGKTADMVMEK
ncbi:dihydroxyacetone kinase, phosphotransfer subunit [Coriobacterium glomerans PW2]|uniref:phosphoenolpyruvate--glycerone phosphotransferase n=1 Tax=Coriobacterium glomerans (strain ATCC 49209 / DSM 20642 / JCM 10262 / PW2) TaxID=700015 RepID=F2N7D4_CORGP|nr:dihydroxyacetone kinase phosphoryl donor subunit DhaM [Coriobacterium glomerans]AEB06609.1 dihydroxyacetone kinase, phosphotransfer subunit [Coriobacterium glomerans PW2]